MTLTAAARLQAFMMLFIITEVIKPGATLTAMPCTISPDPNPAYFPGWLVNCSRRALSQVPQVPEIPLDATTMLLYYNNLSMIPDDSFSQLTVLRELDLSNNKITTLEHNAFRGLINLVTLTLWNNQLVLNPLTYPEDLFTPLQSLQILILGHNSRSLRPPLASKSLGPSQLAAADSRPRASVFKTSMLTADSEKPRFSDAQFLHMDYPDEALSHLRNLRSLSIDGLRNKSFGLGFTRLDHLTHLDMNGNPGYCHLDTVDRNTLANLPHVSHLNLSNCNIFNLTKDAFASLQNLTQLDLSFNEKLGFDMLGEAFLGLSHTKLKSLIIDHVVPPSSLRVTINAIQLRYFGNLSHLESLRARYNRIEAFTDGALCNAMPPNLKHVNVDGNFFELAPYVNDLSCLESLEVLDMNGLEARSMPPLSPPDPEINQNSMRPTSLTRQDPMPFSKVEEISCSAGKHFSMPPKLETFRAKDFGLQYKLHQLKVNTSNSLKQIDVRENHFPVWDGPLCGFHSVTELYLMDTLTEHVNRDFFRSFPVLQILNISGNRLREVFWNDNEGEILNGLANLKVLDLSRNDLGRLPNRTLIHLERLEEIYLRVNGIGTFFLDISYMKHLRLLDLSKNQLRTIPKPTRDHLDWLSQTHKVTVNMTYNPIACNCENMGFLKWIRESKVYFGTTNNYFCSQPDVSGRNIDDIMNTIAELERVCGSYVGVFMGASASCLVVVVLLVVALAYRFRWKLRYLYYASRLSFQRRKKQERHEEFLYDAFVSFASEDNGFVNDELREHLEDEHDLRLCIHTRDFVPGQYITSNIVDCVQQSRRTLVVLTRALLASDWCHYELQMALMENGHTGRDNLLFLLYEHVPAQELSREMLAHLQANSYLEFPHSEQDKDLFWSRLAQALKT